MTNQSSDKPIKWQTNQVTNQSSDKQFKWQTNQVTKKSSDKLTCDFEVHGFSG